MSKFGGERRDGNEVLEDQTRNGTARPPSSERSLSVIARQKPSDDTHAMKFIRRWATGVPTAAVDHGSWGRSFVPQRLRRASPCAPSRGRQATATVGSIR